jgi:hypothetical protein
MERVPLLLPLLLPLVACTANGDDSGEAAACSGTDTTEVGVLMHLEYARAVDGVSHGFDLDGVDSTLGGSSGCGIGDMVDPDGNTGIDNSFANLIPTLELTEAQAVEGIIDSTIKSGELLLMFQLADVDDVEDDSCVDFTLLQGEGTPLLGTDGELLADQTFDPDPTAPSASVDGLSMAGGRVVAAPLDVVLPIQVFDLSLEFTMTQGAMRVDRNEDGTFSGVFGGGVDPAYLLAIAATEDVDDALYGILEGLLANAADLDFDGDGECEALSMNFEFQAVGAYFYE